MTLLQKYYTREFLRAFLVVAVGLSLMLSSIELIDKLEDIVHKTPWNMFKYFLLATPQYIVYTMPVAGLFAGLFVAGQAVRARETVAVLSAGGRLKKLFIPLVLAGAALTLANFVLSEFLAPMSLAEAKKLTSAGKGQSLFRGGTVWVRAQDGSLVMFDLYIREQMIAKGVSIFRFNQGKLTERIDASQAVFRGGQWLLADVRTYDLQGGTVRAEPRMTLPRGFLSPGLFEKEAKKPEEMSLSELSEYMARLRAAGIKNQKLSVDMDSRISYPFVNFIMVLLAIALSLRSGLGGLASASIGVAVSLLYWFSYTIALSMGYAGILPPLVAAWLAPAAFGAVSVRLYQGIRE